MNCREAQKRIVETLGAGKPSAAVENHLADCGHCRKEQQSDEVVLNELRPGERIVASHQLLERTMRAITMEAQKEKSNTSVRLPAWPKWAFAACAAVLLVILVPLVPWGSSNKAGIALLAQSVNALSGVQTVHIRGQMRTLAGDNFEMIGTEYKFLPLEMWHQYGTPDRWRIDKPGRMVVMDGGQSLLLISKDNDNSAMRSSSNIGFVEWLRPLLNPETVLASELGAAKQGRSHATVREAEGTITLTVNRRAQGDLTNDWLRNKSIDTADHTRIYQFDQATKRLKSLDVVVHAGGKDVTVLQLKDFTYNEPLAPTLFSLNLPANVNWLTDPNTMPALSTTLAGPQGVAKYFFEALSREDWPAVQQVLQVENLPDAAKKIYGGLTVIKMGTAFRSGTYAGWFVPYEVRLRSGETKRYNLAIRNDNAQKRWIVDGGW